MVIKNKEDFTLIPALFAWWIREFIASLSSHRPSHVHYPGAMTPLTVLVTSYCLKRGACSSSGLLQACHAAPVLKTDDPKKSWQQCYNRTRTTPFMFLKIQAVLFFLQGTASANKENNSSRVIGVKLLVTRTAEPDLVWLKSACSTHQGREVLYLLRLY